jgi:hypothetical protein
MSIANPLGLSIRIPKDDIDSINEKIRLTRERLVYLETPNCRKYMLEGERRSLIRYTTEKFRGLLSRKSLIYDA